MSIIVWALAGAIFGCFAVGYRVKTNKAALIGAVFGAACAALIAWLLA